MSYTHIQILNTEISPSKKEGFISAGLLKIGMKLKIEIYRKEGDDCDGISERILNISSIKFYHDYIILDFDKVYADNHLDIDLKYFVKTY